MKASGTVLAWVLVYILTPFNMVYHLQFYLCKKTWNEKVR